MQVGEAPSRTDIKPAVTKTIVGGRVHFKRFDMGAQIGKTGLECPGQRLRLEGFHIKTAALNGQVAEQVTVGVIIGARGEKIGRGFLVVIQRIDGNRRVQHFQHVIEQSIGSGKIGILTGIGNEQNLAPGTVFLHPLNAG